jgi:hypothetical protein
MTREPNDGGPRARDLLRQARTFTEDPRFVGALGGAGLDPDRRARALKDPASFLKEAGLTLPDGLALDLFEHPPRHFPIPDWYPFMIELINCRTVYVHECEDDPNSPTGRSCKVNQYELCLGYRVYPYRWPRGPI